MESSASLMDLSSAIKSLERSSDSLECWIMFWTAAVVVGLIIEYGILIWRRVREGDSDHGWGEIVGGILITAGVAGELFVGAMRSTVETKLRAANHQVIVLLNKEVVGRQFTEEQVAKMGDSLKQFAGREMFVTSYAGDAEAARLGLQIKRVSLRR
jgi:hypothetical protein